MKATTTLLTLTIIGLGISSTYFYTRVQSLESALTNMAVMDEIGVIQIVDDRLKAIKKLRTKDRLAELENRYSLASRTPPTNKRVYGDISARYTLIEFADIECGYCRKMHAELKRIVDNSKALINWEFKHFPLPMHNPTAATKALAIECIADNYDNRTAWVAIEQLMGTGKDTSLIPSQVRSYGLNGTIISNCLKSNEFKERINTDYQEGRNLGVTGTPAILIVDSMTKRRVLIKGYKTAEDILMAIQSL